MYGSWTNQTSSLAAHRYNFPAQEVSIDYVVETVQQELAGLHPTPAPTPYPEAYHGPTTMVNCWAFRHGFHEKTTFLCLLSPSQVI